MKPFVIPASVITTIAAIGDPAVQGEILSALFRTYAMNISGVTLSATALPIFGVIGTQMQKCEMRKEVNARYYAKRTGHSPSENEGDTPESYKMSCKILKEGEMKEAKEGKEIPPHTPYKEKGESQESKEQETRVRVPAHDVHTHEDFALVFESVFPDEVKGRSIDEMFEAFWNAYPKRRGKGDARKAFVSQLRLVKGDREEWLGKVLSAILAQKSTWDWQKDDGQYIPYPATWLRSQSWEDEITNNKAEHIAEAQGNKARMSDLASQMLNKL